jgi:hypothetical protein
MVASPFKEGDVVTEEQALPSPLREPLGVSVLVAGVVIETNGVSVKALGVRLGHTVVKGVGESIGDGLTPKLGVQGRVAKDEGEEAALPVPPAPDPEAL